MNAREEIHRGWARWTARTFRTRYPQYETTLYEDAMGFVLHSDIPNESLAELQATVDNKIRPVTCRLRLANVIPAEAVFVDDTQEYGSELWLHDSPLTVVGLNVLLGLAESDLPLGILDASADGRWIFKSFETLDGIQCTKVRSAMRVLGFSADVQFETVERPPQNQLQQTKAVTSFDLALVSSRAERLGYGTRQLLAQDEDEWRSFLRCRSTQETLQPSVNERGDCLFDAADTSDVRLSELLTLYERVNLIPDHGDLSWMARHGIDMADLQEMIELGRCRIILPLSAARYAPTLLDAVAEVDREGLVLSRSLAKRTIIAGQSKDPLLYGPFSAAQKSGMLSLIHRVGIGSGNLEGVLSQSYATILQGQHHSFMMNGAAACLQSGIGSFIGELIFRLHGRDARLELGTAGAAVEWAIGLGAALIPRRFLGGYDETGNCHIVASFISRSHGRPADPVAPRMHTLVDGLLALADVPAMDVARNFRGMPAQRFRTMAARLLSQVPSMESMTEVVQSINAETQKFERRLSRLKKWQLDTAAVAVLAKPVADVFDARLGYYASAGASVLYQLLAAKAPERLKAEVATMATIMQGLMLGASLDAVIVSRSRARLESRV